MAYTTIDDPTIYFNTKVYTGDGASSKSITGVGFQPDWVWIKEADASVEAHSLYDSVRGVQKVLQTNATAAEATESNGLSAFDSDGFTVGASGAINGSGNTIVSWNWIGGGSASSNGNGSITSSVSANTTAGFSIVSYSGTGSNATVGHGLGSAPDVVIIKKRSVSSQWIFGTTALGFTKFLELNLTGGAQAVSNRFNNTDPTSSVFSVGTEGDVNTSGTYIAYCFAEKKGYSKSGSYTGNGSSDGTFVYTGFRPSWIIAKNADASDHWVVFDNKRETTNPMVKPLFPNLNNQQGNSTTYTINFFSNGFKFGGSDGATNSSGNTYVYFAFAESPFVNSNGVPNNAR